MAMNDQHAENSLDFRAGACAAGSNPRASVSPFPPAYIAASLVREWLEMNTDHQLQQSQRCALVEACREFFRSQSETPDAIDASLPKAATAAVADGQRAAFEFEADIGDPNVRASFEAVIESLLDTHRIQAGLDRQRPRESHLALSDANVLLHRPKDPTLYALTKRLTRATRHSLEAR